MKKLVVVVAMFMFVCGGSFFAMAQEPVQNATASSTVVTDTIVKDTATVQKAPGAVNDSTACLAK